jgi:hypothetical protein
MARVANAGSWCDALPLRDLNTQAVVPDNAIRHVAEPQRGVSSMLGTPDIHHGARTSVHRPRHVSSFKVFESGWLALACLACSWSR